VSVLALILALQAPLAPAYVKVTASYLPPAAGVEPAIAVKFAPLDANIRVNEDPAPRLKLDAAQEILVEKPKARGTAGDRPTARRSPAPAPGQTRYLDPILPVTFPVMVGARAARGEHTVNATVTYFYCSKSEGWCRKGTADVGVPIRIP
jgi:hypothetical protein